MKRLHRSRSERGATLVEQTVLVASLLMASVLSIGAVGENSTVSICASTKAIAFHHIPSDPGPNRFRCGGGTESTFED